MYLQELDKITSAMFQRFVSLMPEHLLNAVTRKAALQSGQSFTVTAFFGMCNRPEMQEWMYINKLN